MATSPAMTNSLRPKAPPSECVKVVVRCRPISEMETAQGHQRIVEMHTKSGQIELKNPKESNEPPKTFTFDAIYDWNSKQMDLYDEVFRDLVDSVLNGFNGTIFAYGQTGTGKTFTMEGDWHSPDQRGVIPNSFDQIFQHIAQSHNQQYLVRASYLEIYQEEIRDLLNKDAKLRLELKERPDIGVYVKDLSSFVTKSVEEIQHVMSVGHANRSVGRTNMNEHSSRSHAIFMITIECSEPGADGENHIRVGRLNLVDLAGSERQAKTGAEGDRFKEATKINLSLSALGNVISALVDGKSTHVPYRDSKLTRLLQDSLGGNSKTVMVANIGPASYNYEETLGTLRYANRAKNIKNKPHINEDPKDALLREFQDEIMRLRSILEKRAAGSAGNEAGARRRRRRVKVGADGESITDVDAENNNADDYLKDQQRRLEDEKQAIMANAHIISEEKERILRDLEERAIQLEQEREAQAAVAAKIRAMQSKLLSGDGNLLDKTKDQQVELERKRHELTEQKLREREMLQQLEDQDLTTAEISQTYSNLRQEVELKTKKLKKVKSDIRDAITSHSQERQDLENTVNELNRELKLKLLIVENFIPPDIRDRLRDRAFYDDDEVAWRLLRPGERPKSSASSGDPAVAVGVDQQVGAGESKVNLQPTVTKINHLPSARRMMCDFARAALAHARHRLAAGAGRPALIYSSYPNRVEAFAVDETMRFANENVMMFTALERSPRRTKDWPGPRITDSSPVLKNESLLIDASKIPAPFRTGSRERRGDSRTRSPNSRSIQSKNARARSALGKAIAPATGGGPVYPKARGLVGGK